MFAQMLVAGVSGAWVWPIQQNTTNDLFGNEGELTPSFGGEMFRMLSSVAEGSNLVNVDSNSGYLALEFERSDKLSWVVANGDNANDFQIDLAETSNSYHFAWARILEDAGPLTKGNVTPSVLIDSSIWQSGTSISINLGPSEVVAIELVKNGYGAHIESQQYGTQSASNGIYSDKIVGSSLGDVLVGHIGDDRVSGNNGSDMISGGLGNDNIFGGSGNDLIFAGAGDDSASGGTGSDMLFSGDVVGTASQLYTFVRLGAGLLPESPIGVTLVGWLRANDFCTSIPLTSLNDKYTNEGIAGPNELDKLSGGIGNDFLFSTNQNAILNGGHGNDLIVTGTHSDTVVGGVGDDTIYSQTGGDLLTGGEGADSFIFFERSSTAKSTITDFQHGLDVFEVARSSDGAISVVSTPSQSESLDNTDFTMVGFDLVYRSAQVGEIVFEDYFA